MKTHSTTGSRRSRGRRSTTRVSTRSCSETSGHPKPTRTKTRSSWQPGESWPTRRLKGSRGLTVRSSTKLSTGCRTGGSVRLWGKLPRVASIPKLVSGICLSTFHPYPSAFSQSPIRRKPIHLSILPGTASLGTWRSPCQGRHPIPRDWGAVRRIVQRRGATNYRHSLW